MQKILVVDPLCRTVAGHFFATNNAILSELHGTTRFVAIHRKAMLSLDFGNSVTVWRWPDDRTLAGRMFKRVRRSHWYWKYRVSQNAQAIRAMLQKSGFGPGDAVVAPSASPDLVHSLVEVALAANPSSLPALHIRFLRNDIADDLQAHSALAGAAARIPGIFVYAETQELASLLEAGYSYPEVRQWLVPMNVNRSSMPAPKSDPTKHFTVGLLGGRRKEQGADQIPAIVASLIAEYAKHRTAPMLMLIQLPSNDPAGLLAKRFVASLPTIDKNCPLQLEFLESELSNTAFCHAVNRSHVLLLPYDTASYGERGSGLITEGALAGTPVIVSRGFAMRNWQELAGSPTAGNPSEFSNAIFDVAANYRYYRNGAVRAGREMKRMMAERLREVRAGRDK